MDLETFEDRVLRVAVMVRLGAGAIVVLVGLVLAIWTVSTAGLLIFVDDAPSMIGWLGFPSGEPATVGTPWGPFELPPGAAAMVAAVLSVLVLCVAAAIATSLIRSAVALLSISRSQPAVARDAAPSTGSKDVPRI